MLLGVSIEETVDDNTKNVVCASEEVVIRSLKAPEDTSSVAAVVEICNGTELVTPTSELT